MEVGILNLQRLFDMRVRYEIPQYQRRYVWNQADQWEPLWEDIRNAAENCLEDGNYKTAHFMGAVVIQQKPHRTGALQMPEVVDGQQRLTTMQLLLDAVQEVFEHRKHANSAIRLSDMVLNSEAYRDGDSDRAFKVWPTMGDQDAFRQTMHNHLPSDEYKGSLIVQAHEFFKLQVEHWLGADAEENEKIRAETLEHVVTQLLQLVVIDLASDEEPHVIFETLNARGTPLLQSDLIKNMILHQASRSSSSLEETRLWGFDGDWWRQEIPQGRLRRPRSDVFLNYWLMMRLQEEVTHNNVFSIFRDYFRKEGNSDVQSVTDDLRKVGDAYASLGKATVPGMDTFLYRIGVMQAGVLTPVLLWLVSSDVSKDQLQRGVRALESYLVRRMVCRMTTKDYNRLFLGLIGELEKAGPAGAGDKVVDYLEAQTANSREWPKDRVVHSAFTSSPLYRLLTRARLRIVLEGVEGELQTNKASIQSVPRNLTIEHVLPQAWRQNWPLSGDLEDPTQAGIDRDHILHTIGNLTLVNKRLNSSLSNAGWDDKRKTLRDHFNLFLNKEIVEEAIWNEERIESRARELAEVAIKVWPHADGI